MAGKRKIIFYCLIFVIAAAYLTLAYFFIFYRIGAAGLKAPVGQDSYILGSEKTTAKNLTYAALGDSLTAGVGASIYQESYPYLLALDLAARGDKTITLKNFSNPGDKTSDLINNLLAPAIASKPDLVTLLIGVNDVYDNVSPAVFKKNYQSILDRLTKETTAKIYLINLPFVGSSELLLKPYDYYFYGQIGKFNEIIRELAVAYNLKYIDLATPALAESKTNQSYYSGDLFHPSASGYKFWAKIIYDDINQ